MERLKNACHLAELELGGPVSRLTLPLAPLTFGKASCESMLWFPHMHNKHMRLDAKIFESQFG